MTSTAPPSSRRRAWALAMVLWAFGLSTTTLLVGLWGRSVTSDEAALTGSARAVLGAEVVGDRVHGWLADAVTRVIEVVEPDIDPGLVAVATSPAAELAVTRLIDGFVAAALAPPGSETSIDVAAAVDPLIPPLVAELEARGIDVPLAELTAAVEDASAVVLETEEALGSVGSVYRARTLLTRVLLVGIAAQALFGSLAVWLSDDRSKMVRTLATRLAVGAGTFVLFLRISAWAVDPEGGRTPLGAGGSVLLASNHQVLFMVAAGAAAVALVAGIFVRRRRRRRRADETQNGAPVDEELVAV